ncbi:hypothetical protein M426DRAFT_15225 [Hypoxylon sp. CI-4A]|nr:hypothetical protein M426DRAFT_15225 [Hypoxylon sp. CI-4A]
MEATPFREKAAVLEERDGKIQVRVVNNDGEKDSTIVLTGLKTLFQNQLPEMPKDYIARLVYDRNHLSIAIVNQSLQVLGGITWRQFPERKFAEIVFCAIATDKQTKGYGSHIMDHLKDYVKATSPIMHFLTYADNNAIGYFKKQGFTLEITLQGWQGRIKDYAGGTLMQCEMIARIRYLELRRTLHKQKEVVKAKIRAASQSDVVHQPPAQWANGVIAPIDPLSIPAIQATGWSPDMDKLSREPRRSAAFNQLRRFLQQIQNHNRAWPFQKPVDEEDAPDYYAVIKTPMDLSTIEEKLHEDKYPGPYALVKDLTLMFDNARIYNGVDTVYCKCANALEKYMKYLIKGIPEWSYVLE